MMDQIGAFSEDKLPTLKYSQFQGSLKQSRVIGSSQQALSQPKHQGVYTVYESLQDEYVYKNLDLALGSLNQFVDLKCTDPQPMLPNLRLHQRKNRLKQQQNKEDSNEFFLKKQHNTQQEKNPYDLLKTADDEKTRGTAAKQIVQMIFKKIYGDEVEKFEEKNSRKVLQQKYIIGEDIDNPRIAFIKKNVKKSKEERFELFEKQMASRQSGALKLKVELSSTKLIRKKDSATIRLGNDDEDNSLVPSSEQKSREKERSRGANEVKKESPKEQIPLNIQTQKIKAQKSQFFGTSFKKLIVDSASNQQSLLETKQRRLKKIQKLIFMYPTMGSLWSAYWKDSGLKGNETDILTYIEAQKSAHNNIQQFFQTYNQQIDRQNAILRQISDLDDRISSKASKLEVVIVDTRYQIVIRNVELTDQVLPWLLMETEQWNSIEKIEFYNTTLSDSAMKLLLNIILLECVNLRSLTLSQNQLTPASFKLIEEILLTKQQMQVLKLSATNMTSKDFVQLCLTICEASLKEIDFSYNKIDQRGQKPLETLLRYVKSLESVDMQNNLLTDDSEEGKTKLFRQLRKIIIYNEGLKNKNIKL